jgi:hypothetical protein
VLPETVGVISPYHDCVGYASTVRVCDDEPDVVVVMFVPAPELFQALREAVIIGDHVEFVVVVPTNRIVAVRVVKPYDRYAPEAAVLAAYVTLKYGFVLPSEV